MVPRSRKPTLLVPVDFSKTSERGLERAGALARELGARLVLVLVTPVTPGYDEVTGPGDLYRDGTLVSLNQHLRTLAAQNAGEDIESWSVVLVDDGPAQTIAAYASQIGADMIVIGTHGRTGLDRLFRPSIAEQVVRLARCPVVTVGPQREHPGPPLPAPPFMSHPRAERRAGRSARS